MKVEGAGGESLRAYSICNQTSVLPWRPKGLTLRCCDMEYVMG